MGVSFSPEVKLGRMLYTVQANAYEMAECTLSNLKYYNILTLGEY
jgi:hypothetical protein